jgi:hypothetical protein
MSKPKVLQQLRASLTSMNSMRPQGHPLAVDFGVSALRVLKLGPGEPASIQAAAQLDTPDDLLDNPAKRILFQFDALPKLVRSGKMSGLRAACVIPPAQVSCKHIQVPVIEGASPEQLAAETMASKLGCDPTALLVRSCPVPTKRHPGKQELVCFAASRAFVSRMMDALKRAKLEPVGIHNAFETLEHVVTSATKKDDDDQATLVIDLGTATTLVMIVHKGAIVFARAIEHGANTFDDAIKRQFRCTMLEARRMRAQIQTLVPAAAPVGAGATETLEPAPRAKAKRQPDLAEQAEILVDEINMCLRYHKASLPEVPIGRALFIGGLAAHPAISSHLARVLRLETRVIDPLSTLARAGKIPVSGVDLSSPQPGWATTVGCALSPTDL